SCSVPDLTPPLMLSSSFSRPGAHRDLRSFPTRRSSDLITVEAARLNKNVLIARLKGIRDRNSAEVLNGVSLFIDRSRLPDPEDRSEEHTSELQSRENLVCRLLLEKKNAQKRSTENRAHS